MDGVTILSKYYISGWDTVCMLLFIISFFLLFYAVLWASVGGGEGLLIYGGLGIIIFIISLTINSKFAPAPEEIKYTYKITITEETSIQEIMENYEILRVKGNTLVIKDK